MKRRRTDKRWKRLPDQADDTERTLHYTPQDYKSLLTEGRREESNGGAGILRPVPGKLPTQLNEIGIGDEPPAPMPRIVKVIVLGAIIFIAVIAYLVAQMPAKP